MASPFGIYCLLHVSSFLLFLLSSDSKRPLPSLPVIGHSQARLMLIHLLEFSPSLLPSPAPWLCVNTQQKLHLQRILANRILSALTSPILVSCIYLPHSAPNPLLISQSLHRRQMGFPPPTLDWGLYEGRASADVTNDSSAWPQVSGQFVI